MNSIYEIYKNLYDYFFIVKNDTYNNYKINIHFSYLAISFNILDITKDKSSIRIVCDEQVKLC